MDGPVCNGSGGGGGGCCCCCKLCDDTMTATVPSPGGGYKYCVACWMAIFVNALVTSSLGRRTCVASTVCVMVEGRDDNDDGK